MHGVLCIVWASGAQRNPRAKEGRSRAGGTAQSALLGVDQSPMNHVPTKGGLPGSWSPNWWCAALLNLSHPLQLWPESVQAGGGGASSLVAGGAGQSLYQIPLDLPPGGARIRAEARFGTWSSI